MGGSGSGSRYGRGMTAIPGLPANVRRLRVDHGPLDLVATTFPLRQGLDDPTMRVVRGEVWRALRTRDGPATLHLRLDGGELVASAVGPGADAALDLAPRLAGLDDDPAALQPLHDAVAQARRRSPGLRLTAGTAVADAVVWVVIAQKVVGFDARRAYRDLVRRLGEPAPGDQRLLLPPDPARVAREPYWTFHECNIERRRATVVLNAALRAPALNALAELPAAQARERLQSLPGVGPWTAAEVTAVSHGDPDAVPLGDYHVPNVVAYALAGEPRADDARMLELLEPYAGQRGRVIRLLMSGGRGAPRYGPRLSRQDIRGR
jgi:3-methyladenine DNA glycosylase/8-oxoguanine DNA glycosylase